MKTVVTTLQIEDHVTPMLRAAEGLMRLAPSTDFVPSVPDEVVRSVSIPHDGRSTVTVALLPTPQLARWIGIVADAVARTLSEEVRESTVTSQARPADRDMVASHARV